MKKVIVVLVILTMLLSIASCTKVSPTLEPNSSVSKPYDGTIIRMASVTGVFTDSVQAHLEEFTERTGISINLELYADQQLNQKLITEFLAGNSTVDVFAISPTQNLSAYSKNGWSEPLTDYLDDPEFGWEDFDGVDMTSCMNADSEDIGALPILSNIQMLFYRKDVFEEHNLTPPTTYAELLAVCETLNDPANNFYAVALRGEKIALTSQFSPFLYGFGGRWITDGVCVFDTPEALEAVKFYGKLVGTYGPPSLLSAGYAQMTQIFNSGQVAMVIDADALYPTLTNPTESNYYDKVGVAPIPAGPEGLNSYIVPAWAISMYSGSNKKDAAWEVIKLVMSLEVAVDNSIKGMSSYRKSVWTNARLLEEMPNDMAKAYEVTYAASKGTLASIPILTAASEARDYIGVAIVKSIETKGESEEIFELMQSATAIVNQLLKDANEYGEDYPFTWIKD